MQIYMLCTVQETGHVHCFVFYTTVFLYTTVLFSTFQEKISKLKNVPFVLYMGDGFIHGVLVGNKVDSPIMRHISVKQRAQTWRMNINS